jgi:4-amino-4-deoxy-L-arabinose transferase and related glycosyltransferases of PMT family
VKTILLRKFATVPFLVGILLLLGALTFYYFAVLRVDYSRTALLNLRPRPDATEYLAQAEAMLHGEWPLIQIGYEKLPSRYPFGYPVLMLPWLKILPAEKAILAPFRTNQTLGLLFLLIVFGFYAYLSMPLTGGFAALLLATLPGFFTFCRSSMSDIGASLLIIVAFMFAYLGLNEERRWKIYLSAVFLGLSLNIRTQSIFFAPLLLAMALFPMRGTRWRWFVHCAALPFVFVLATIPMLLVNMIQFHSPFKTGYYFWVEGWLKNTVLFSLSYIPHNVATLWREFALRPHGFNTAYIFGTGTSFVGAFALLICAGLFFIRIDRFIICACLAGLTFLATPLSFIDKFVDTRYYLPLLILLVSIAVLPVEWAGQSLLAGRRIIAALAVFVLFAAACLGYPSRSGYNTHEIDRSQAWDALHFTKSPRQSEEFIAQKQFAEILGRQSGIVLSDIDPVYLNTLLPRSFVAAPIDGKHHFIWSEMWHYDRPQALALVKRGLEQSMPVYALFTSQNEMATQQSRLPSVRGYEWHVLDDSGAKAAILKLAPVAANETTTPPG